MIQNRERMYLNIVKGIAILLMLWGHGIQYCAKGSFDPFSNNVFLFIYSFHMPLFMLVSGYLFFFSYQKRDLKTLLVHRTQGMLQPIVFGSMLNVVLIELPTMILHQQGTLINGRLFNSLNMLWFLWCVLSALSADRRYLRRCYERHRHYPQCGLHQPGQEDLLQPRMALHLRCDHGSCRFGHLAGLALHSDGLRAVY